MISEGFREGDILEALCNGRLLEEYGGEDRCLISGRFSLTASISEHLHVVVDFWREGTEVAWIDIVTAYVPRRPFWATPFLRGKDR